MVLRKSVLLLGVLICGCQVAPPETGSKVEQVTKAPVGEDPEVLLVKEIASRFDNNKAEITLLLLDLTVHKDDMDQTYFIGPCQPGYKTGIHLYLVLGSGPPSLRFRVDYVDYGGWTGVIQSFKVAAGDYRWQSPPCAFRGNYISQYYDIPATTTEIELAKRLAQAHKAVVRFQELDGYRDKELLAPAWECEKILRLYELMGGKPLNG
jgi:hypothetical protein